MADIGSITALLGEGIANIPLEWLIILIVIIIWKLVWYGLALYKSLERKQIVWFTVLFVCTFILNDLGLIAIIYLLLNKDPEPKAKVAKKRRR
ncbi:hypothetical protein A3K73_08335 [Candidatus Pacearchaeota archaeon RBG_13_36_9]|nr:MAG: hypothetical protein A3K73_08335 [Candidatus Pacearchaeota archaeon RBG_13_36_9]